MGWRGCGVQFARTAAPTATSTTDLCNEALQNELAFFEATGCGKLRSQVESAAEYGGQPLALAHLQAVQGPRGPKREILPPDSRRWLLIQQGDGDVKSTSVAAALQMSLA